MYSRSVSATDDWPFFYLGRARNPAGVSFGSGSDGADYVDVRGVRIGGKIADAEWTLLFSRRGFLLIETISVTRFALLFGSTWVVNSIVFSAILFVVLIANLWMDRIRSLNIHLLYVLLAVAVVVNFLFPIESLLGVGLVIRLAVSMILMASPIFFAAFIFAHSYKQTTNPDLAFASNLLGAVLGGLLEYSSLIIGFRRLFLIALALYALSYVALLLPTRKVATCGA